MRKRTAIIHDWLNGMRGGEKVLEEILSLFPDADIFTLFLEEERISAAIKAHKIITSPLNKYGFVRKHYRHFLPLFPAAIEEFNLEGYDIVISISHCAAKGVITFPGSIHISYVNSPMRYIWDQYYSYFGHTRGLKKAFIMRQFTRLRNWDVTSSARVDHFIGNSSFIKERIKKYYRRDADVIHPPVDTDFYRPAQAPRRDYFLTVSALVPYKGTELLVRTFNRTGDRLVIVGKGPDEKKLKKMAAGNIEFKKDISGEELRELYQHAAAFVYGGIEDFGIVFVEALACGTPVLAIGRGGVRDIVRHGETGILYEHGSEEDLLSGIEKIKKTGFDTSFLRENSLQFSKKNFQKKFKEMIEGLC